MDASLVWLFCVCSFSAQNFNEFPRANYPLDLTTPNLPPTIPVHNLTQSRSDSQSMLGILQTGLTKSAKMTWSASHMEKELRQTLQYQDAFGQNRLQKGQSENMLASLMESYRWFCFILLHLTEVTKKNYTIESQYWINRNFTVFIHWSLIFFFVTSGYGKLYFFTTSLRNFLFVPFPIIKWFSITPDPLAMQGTSAVDIRPNTTSISLKPQKQHDIKTRPASSALADYTRQKISYSPYATPQQLENPKSSKQSHT